MGIPCVNTVLMLDDDIVSEARIVADGNDLSVSRRNNRITRAVRRKIKSLMDIPLAGNRVHARTERHGNMRVGIAQRPDARNFRKQRVNTLFTEIPSIWPLSNPNAHISMAFGPSVHPITGQWYIHKGLDFSTYRSGDPIIATANGQVVTVGYDASFGNYVIIKHKHGIYTRYAHMMYSIVSKGQFVSQREVIGYVGNTGITTGPHLHYEVHIGSDVVDPAKYINVKLSD